MKLSKIFFFVGGKTYCLSLLRDLEFNGKSLPLQIRQGSTLNTNEVQQVIKWCRLTCTNNYLSNISIYLVSHFGRRKKFSTLHIKNNTAVYL
jgi:hypothetical protein